MCSNWESGNIRRLERTPRENSCIWALGGPVFVYYYISFVFCFDDHIEYPLTASICEINSYTACEAIVMRVKKIDEHRYHRT